MKLLLFSNSTNVGEEYLSYTLPYIQKFLANGPCEGIFIPYAAVSFTYDKYYQMVETKLSTIGIKLNSIHNSSNPLKAISESTLIIIGGGNTFALIKKLQDLNLMDAIQSKVLNGTPYIGWSAGSNIACPTIKTTNDMPIVQPASFNALNLIPFQINPHYTDLTIEGHGGESRETRINEFLIANPGQWVVGLREGTLIELSDRQLSLKGAFPCKIFKSEITSFEVDSVNDLNFLMQ